MLRGTRRGLEVVFGGRAFEEALEELKARLAEQPEFYRGTSAIALFDEPPQSADFAVLQTVLEGYGIRTRALSGPLGCQAVAQAAGVDYAGETPRVWSSKRRRLARERTAVALSDAARSLVADFEGARKDRAGRRVQGKIRSFPAQAPAPADHAKTGTLYHDGTLRGGQALHHIGNVVIVGDVNPGAEVIASGDIVVFGTLRGVAHAGAQGNVGARVFALELAPTQLRIAAAIAADFKVLKRGAAVPECALLVDQRISVVRHDRAPAAPGRLLTESS